MAKHRVSALILDEHNLAEIARHGVSAGEVLQIDEQTAEVHDGHPVEFLVSVRLDPEESRLLSELAEAEGADPPATMRAALRHYAAARAQRASR